MISGCRYNKSYRPPSLELQHGPVIESYVELQFSSYFRNGTLLCYSSKLLTQGFYINRVQAVISNTPGLIFLSTTPVIFGNPVGNTSLSTKLEAPPIHHRATMLVRAAPLLTLLTMMTMAISAQSQGLQVSLERTVPLREEGKPCGQFVCLVQGNSVSINTVTISRVKTIGEPTELLAVTTSTPEMNISAGNIQGNGTLRANSAAIYIELSDPSSCGSDFIASEVTFTSRSGHSGASFTIAGPGTLPKLQAVPKADKECQETRTGLEAERVSSVEKYFSSRLSRLEDRVSSILLSGSPDTSSDVAQSLADMERRLEDLTAAVEQVNVSKVASPDGGHQDVQPVVCERGMGDRVTKTYPRYVITTDQTIQRQILCETQTDGGGWTVIQRRAAGDVDFYRDWTAYRKGFGSLTVDFWLGNEAIYNLTDTYPYELRIDFRVNGQEMFAEYSTFRIEDESDKYRLRLGSYSGTIGEKSSHGLSLSNNQQFSTFDRDNDAQSVMNCAVSYHGAWWYNSCHNSNLNGIWLEKAPEGVSWYNGSTWLYPEFTELKIRRVRQQIG
ncbi:hypothetical protein RRG08_042080 [Elysia crispata]|uniref:Fibrinogen C-terminal domain-containing protein n=1 Tax=Elysia crispata TaxID=231223 RepID=A0AAE1A8B5_9GAST|nr:hypothetical protein RRG08_042080 [Elysia crispata]